METIGYITVGAPPSGNPGSVTEKIFFSLMANFEVTVKLNVRTNIFCKARATIRIQKFPEKNKVCKLQSAYLMCGKDSFTQR